MGRARRRIQFLGRFVGLEYLMMDTPAFKALSGNEVKLLLLLCRKHNGENNGQIGCSVREGAAFLGCTANTAGRCFCGLQERGFAVIMSKGAFSVKHRKATLWRLTFYPSLGGKPATRDYARWHPNEANAKKQRTVSPEDTHSITG